MASPNPWRNFSDKMQLMNAVGYQSIFEADGHKLNETGGVMLWKLNAALPSVIWQIYDWYLEPNAGYYAMQNAVEPLHIQFNQDDSTVAVINRMHHATGLLTAKADIYNINSKLIKSLNAGRIDIGETGAQQVIKLKETLAGTYNMSFVVLNLTNAAGKVVSHNAYWLSPANDFKALNEMPRTQVQVKILKTEKGQQEDKWIIQISNNTDKIAFFIRPQLMKNGDEVMPSYWTGNYFTLAPHEAQTVSVSAPVAKLGIIQPTVLVEGWNVEKQVVNLPVK